ncbi:hypothetical protein J2W44_006105 [Priestia aryabhattai]|uniref:hypothetical protein n=1 Tax=Priestia aryabhattai TaxID=412384 RepID=UPI0027E4520C|nr:hypothetical protein [Priestia aryabhattai]MDP9726949.1 hypothetical protein [Priestia aryabhattai]
MFFEFDLESQLEALNRELKQLYKEFNEYEYQGEGDDYGRTCECGMSSVHMNGLCVKCDLGYRIEAIENQIDLLESALEEEEEEEE